MRVASLRRIDRWLGVPLCALLTLARRLVPRALAAVPHRPAKILFVKLAEQGSTIHARPALQRAIEWVGRENVYFAVFGENRFILDALALIPEQNVIAIDARSPATVLRTALGALARMRREAIDTAIDLEFFARSSALLCFLSGARARVGFHSFHGEAAYRGDLMTHRLAYNPRLHVSQVFSSLVDALRVAPRALPTLDSEPLPPEEEPAPLELSCAELEAMRERVRRSTACDVVPPLVLLNANCSDLLPLRRWPPERYVELARKLLASDVELRIAFTGSPAEAPATLELARAVGSERCLSLAGQTTLRELLALYHVAQVLVTNDSGPAQFAALTPIDAVVLFGPETPEIFAARSPRTHVLWARIACSPCVNAFNDRWSACTDNRCMQRIEVEQVLATVQRIRGTRAAQARR